MSNKIQTLREQQGITREGLAKKANVARSKIYLYESGKGNPSVKTLTKIAGALGVKPSDLI